MAHESEKKRSREDAGAIEKPPPEGATYRTSKRAKIGVGNEQPPLDLREKSEE